MEAGELCCDLTTDGTDVWAIDPAGRLLQIGDGGVDRADPVDIDARNAHTNVVYAGGSLWVSSDTTPLHRIDPATGATTDVDVGGGVPFLEHDGLVWGASPTEIWAVDPATGQVAERIALEGSTEVLSLNFDADGRRVGRHPPCRTVGAVLQLDQRTTGAVKTELIDVDIQSRIEFGFGSIWITDCGGSSLVSTSPPFCLRCCAVDLNHLNLRVRDAAACRDFYQQHFGFRPAFEADGGYFIRNDDGFLLALIPADPHQELPRGLPHRLRRRRCRRGARAARGARRLRACASASVEDFRPDEQYVTFRCWDPDGTEVEIFWEAGPSDLGE